MTVGARRVAFAPVRRDDDGRQLRARAPWDVIASTLHLRDDPAVDFIVRDLRLPTALTGAARRARARRRRASCSRRCSPTRSPRPTSSASRRARACSRSLRSSSSTSAAPASPWRRSPGRCVSAALIYVLAWRDGISGYRFILIGIGVSEFMLSLVGYIVARAEHLRRARGDDLARRLGRPGRDRASCARSSSAVALLLPVALLLERAAAHARARRRRGHGARRARRGLPARRSSRSRSSWSRFATAAAGPIMFVALIAGPDRPRACSARRRAASSPPAFVGRDHRARVRPRRRARAAGRAADRRRHRRDRRAVPDLAARDAPTARDAADDEPSRARAARAST